MILADSLATSIRADREQDTDMPFPASDLALPVLFLEFPFHIRRVVGWSEVLVKKQSSIQAAEGLSVHDCCADHHAKLALGFGSGVPG
ncbi:predicted protein [Plenodomus lingam JN3]|uniref:Uncharacterized protein n=1 Tax=Leptosphaeria maculans (strain JN3 / isolate v23.1.3 / race Av1-4-5-6-7-8) TaxID=985895 RepID=E5A741_LEPMJ|nr:predicted protein [Plenodomus lingam JN3]CBX99436.1 predicted protein [Plenodomus lingam JN3]